MSMNGQGTKRQRKIAENFNRLSRVHERYRRQTNGRAIAYSEREREYTFAKNQMSEFHQISYTCYLWPWLGSPLTAMQYVMYFRFCG